MIDFVRLLLKDSRYNRIVTMTDRLSGADIQIKLCQIDMMVEEFVELFFNKQYCKNRLPWEIISNQDHLFLSGFWSTLYAQTSVKLKMLTVYYSKTDSVSECTNKTVSQLLWFYVDY